MGAHGPYENGLEQLGLQACVIGPENKLNKGPLLGLNLGWKQNQNGPNLGLKINGPRAQKERGN